MSTHDRLAMMSILCALAMPLLHHMSPAQYVNVRINSIANQPEEVVIATNPTNPLELAAARR